LCERAVPDVRLQATLRWVGSDAYEDHIDIDRWINPVSRWSTIRSHAYEDHTLQGTRPGAPTAVRHGAGRVAARRFCAGGACTHASQKSKQRISSVIDAARES